MHNDKNPRQRIVLQTDCQTFECEWSGKWDKMRRPIYNLLEVTGSSRHPMGQWVIHEYEEDQVVYWRYLEKKTSPGTPVLAS